jgi:Family of unknown function (DUF6526)
MSTQNYSNHTRFDKLYHFTIVPLVLIGFIGSIVNFSTSSADNSYVSALLVVVFFILFLVAGLARIYSLKVQDRVIRNEENFRHFLLTGKPLDSKLQIRQIISLRFASDAEFPSLAQRALAENLSPQQIKKAISEWRGDYYRV